MNNNENPSFFDKKTIMAVVSVAVVYIGWQNYLQKKYPQYGKPEVKNSQAVSKETTAPNKVLEIPETPAIAPSAEQTFKVTTEDISFELSSLGMGLKSYTISSYKDKDKNFIKIGTSNQGSLFEMRLGMNANPIPFAVSQTQPGHFVGVAQLGKMTIRRELIFNPKNSSFTNSVTFLNPSEELRDGFGIVIPESVHVQQSGSVFFPSYEHQDFFVIHQSGKKETINFSAAKENIDKELSTSSVLSVSSQYFAAAILDKSEIIPSARLRSSIESKNATGELFYKPTQLKDEMTFSSVFYAGPKSIDALKTVDPELANIIDLGFFDFIARPLLYLMKALHSAVGNWGFAIILLTLLVRLFVLPFNIMSFKSMKAMQKVQPKLQALREKYKDDAARLNQEMMSVMKQNGANPLGGCLPMLIQIPVFFALYRVIGSSIELYSSPFVGWIHDLSAHDPFYVLPILMAVFMFVQQKITPTTMDPVQAKIMMWLPVVFSVFMLQLPSGLTLYMVVSTLFGIIQQYLILKEKKTSAT